jgi:hypothetical protein
MKRISKIAFVLLVAVYVIAVVGELFRLFALNVIEGRKVFDTSGFVWANILTPFWMRNPEDIGWRLIAAGKVIGALLVGWVIVKKRVRL